MRFTPPLTPATFVRRYKRFCVDVEDADGRIQTVHVAATGRMTGCSSPGMPVGLSFHPSPSRSLPFSLELVDVGPSWVLVNSILPNRLVEEAILAGVIPALHGYERLSREVRYAQQHRIDLLLERPGQRCYVEVKNATLMRDGLALFPDAMTARGTLHLEALEAQVRAGQRAVLVLCAGRSDCRAVGVADDIDPVYARAIQRAAQAGVEVLGVDTALSLTEARVCGVLPVCLPG